MTATLSAAGVKLTCDCHHTQTMAMVQQGRLTIMLRSHGERHFVDIPLDKLRALVGQLERRESN